MTLLTFWILEKALGKEQAMLRLLAQRAFVLEELTKLFPAHFALS